MATIDLILFLVFPTEAFHVCIALTLGKLYSNSLLVIFNSRIRILGARNFTPGNTFHSYQSSSNNQSVNKRVNPTPVVLSPRTAANSLNGIRVDQETWIDDADIIPMENKVRYTTVLSKEL